MEWVISCNVTEKFDIQTYLAESNEICWRQRANFSVGDIVYIYLSKTHQYIAYKTSVIATNISLPQVCNRELWNRCWISDEEYQKALDLNRFVLLQLEGRVDQNHSITWNELKLMDCPRIQGPVKLNECRSIIRDRIRSLF